MKKIIFLTLIFVIPAFGWWYFSYSDRVITSGTGYGFTIGMTKVEAIRALRENYPENPSVELSPEKYKNRVDEIRIIRAKEIEPDIIEKMNSWQILIGGSEKNVLVLGFKNEKLEKIVRYRSIFIM